MNGYCNTEGHGFSLLCKKHNPRDGLVLTVKAVAITYTGFSFLLTNLSGTPVCLASGLNVKYHGDYWSFKDEVHLTFSLHF